MTAPVISTGDLGDLLSRYWQLAYAEGWEHRTHDTKDRAAQETLSAITALFADQQAMVQRLVSAGNEDVALMLEMGETINSAQSRADTAAARIQELEHEVASAGALRLRMNAHRLGHEAARANFLTMQGAAAQLLKRAQTAETHLRDIIRAHDANSGNEPSISVFERAIDLGRSALGEQPEVKE